MASDERKKAGDLSRFSAFKQHPETYHIFQALRLIEAKYADQPRLGRSRKPRQDPVRLKQRVDMAFASSTVARFREKNAKTGEPGELAQYMFGLFGPNGPLPLHLTEYAYNRQHSFRDPTFKAFGDIFHHRMLSLLYRAYASGEPTSSFDRVGEMDPFAQKVAAFAGLKGAAFSQRDAMPDLAKLRYSGRLAHGTRNEEGLLALISGFFGAPATMESFVGTWLELDKKDTWELGNPHKPAKLGQSCSLGSRVWTRQAKFRFRVGPVGLAEYKRLLPGGDSLKRLKSLVNNYMGEAMMWDMNLVLRKGEAERAMLARAVQDDEVSIVVSHEEKVVKKVERADEVPLTKAPITAGIRATPAAKDAFTATPTQPVSGDPLANAAPFGAASAGAQSQQTGVPSAGARADGSDGQDVAKAFENEAGRQSEGAPHSAKAGTPNANAETEGPDSRGATAAEAAKSGSGAAPQSGPFDQGTPPPPPPLDMEKTVVIPVMAPPSAAKTATEIDFGGAPAHSAETPQIPPLSNEKRHEDDTRPPPSGVYLGWTAWLGTPPDDKDLDQLFIE